MDILVRLIFGTFPLAASIIIMGIFLLTLIDLVIAAWLAWLSESGQSKTDAHNIYPLTPPGDIPRLTIIIPAFNEHQTIVRTARAACASDYPGFLEIIIVNDGSRDGTIDVLKCEFKLKKISRPALSYCMCKNISAIYSAVLGSREVLIVDKENGGKADALNAGINLARGMYICVIDADTVLEPDGISSLWRAMASGANVVAAGGQVGVSNGTLGTYRNNLHVGWRTRMLIDLQILEYAREFIVGRLAKSQLGMLAVISGAFGMFHRDVLVEVGGYKTDTVGEDFEIVVRIHRYMLEHKKAYQIRFVADAVAWTEVPDTLSGLAVQRSRWARAAIQTFIQHRYMLIGRRYGRIGIIGIGSIVITDIAAPIFYLLGLPTILASCMAGIVNWDVAVGLGFLLTVPTFVADLHAFGTFRTFLVTRPDLAIDAGKLFWLSVVNLLFYRNILLLFRAYGIWQQMTRPYLWGTITRRGF